MFDDVPVDGFDRKWTTSCKIYADDKVYVSLGCDHARFEIKQLNLTFAGGAEFKEAVLEALKEHAVPPPEEFPHGFWGFWSEKEGGAESLERFGMRYGLPALAKRPELLLRAIQLQLDAARQLGADEAREAIREALGIGGYF